MDKKKIMLGVAAGAAGTTAGQFAKGSNDKGERTFELRVGGGDTKGAGFDLAPSILAIVAGGAAGGILGGKKSFRSGAVMGAILGLAANGFSSFASENLDVLAPDPSENFADLKGIAVGAVSGALFSTVL